MKKWYRSAPMKCVLLILEHIFAALLAVCIIWGAVYPGREYSKVFLSSLEDNYADTKGFTDTMEEALSVALERIQMAGQYETDGKYDANKIVDIKEYYDEGNVTGENESGFAYTVGQLVQMEKAGGSSTPNTVVVCKKADGSYYYYLYSEFKGLVEKGELQILSQATGEDVAENTLKDIEARYSDEWSSDSWGVYIADAQGQILYTESWNLINWINESQKPEGAEHLIDIANTNSIWNGKLNEMYDMLAQAIEGVATEVEGYKTTGDQYTEGNTNLTYLLADLKSEKIYTNKGTLNNFTDLEKNISELKKSGKYINAAPRLVDFKTNTKMEAKDYRGILGSQVEWIVDGDYQLIAVVDTSYPIQDEFYSNNQLYEKYAPWMEPILIFGICALAGGFICFIWLTMVAGRTKEDGELKLFSFDLWKTEIWIIIVSVLFTITFVSVYDGIFYGALPSSNMGVESAVFACAASVCTAVFLTGYLGFVRRIKAKTLWKNSILRWLIRFVKEIFAHRSGTFRVGGICIGITLLQCLLIMGPLAIITVAGDIWIFIYAMRGAIAKQKIKDGLGRIAGGDVNYKISLEGLRGDNLDMAVRINNIGEGLNAAVEENLKNERLKTDLITNVSHDIKTPLTSIINYVDLLKRENFTDPKILGYLGILEAKSQRLKHLTEDVVEASKISSGNIHLEFMNLNLVEMIHQTSGEFVEKFEKRSLTLVPNLPEEPAVIRADGRRMWRILENVYNNAAKYAMEGTRVYADLVVNTRTIEFSFKNVSEQPLNISADELTERFIRGDVSRGTEGSGLGLSIAQNLTTLQGGRFDLYLDGDLFKVTICFPKVYQKAGARGNMETENQPEGPNEPMKTAEKIKEETI